MKETRVYGMAKSSLDLRGAKRQKLELDYLRLVHFCQRHQSEDCQTFGYLAVASPAFKPLVETWAAKYGVPAGAIHVIVPEMEELDREELLAEKGRNRVGNLAKADPSLVLRQADGSFGRDLMERALEARILREHPGLANQAPLKHHPQEINWDFYGKY
jgi:hypothetical protein